MTVKDKLVDLYRNSSDPWGFETSWYEQRKRALTLAALPKQRYASGYEPGCSTGVLSRELASRCDRLIVSDFVPAALEQARARLKDSAHVRIAELATPSEWPDERFDLIVLSELAYFLEPAQVDELAERVARSCATGATVLAVHWCGPIDEWALPAPEAHARIQRIANLRGVSRHTERDFLLEVFER